MMPASSEAQRKAACAAYAVKKGDRPKSELQGTSKEMYESMSEDELRDYCKQEPEG